MSGRHSLSYLINLQQKVSILIVTSQMCTKDISVKLLTAQDALDIMEVCQSELSILTDFIRIDIECCQILTTSGRPNGLIMTAIPGSLSCISCFLLHFQTSMSFIYIVSEVAQRIGPD